MDNLIVKNILPDKETNDKASLFRTVIFHNFNDYDDEYVFHQRLDKSPNLIFREGQIYDGFKLSTQSQRNNVLEYTQETKYIGNINYWRFNNEKNIGRNRNIYVYSKDDEYETLFIERVGLSNKYDLIKSFYREKNNKQINEVVFYSNYTKLDILKQFNLLLR